MTHAYAVTIAHEGYVGPFRLNPDDAIESFLKNRWNRRTPDKRSWVQHQNNGAVLTCYGAVGDMVQDATGVWVWSDTREPVEGEATHG